MEYGFLVDEAAVQRTLGARMTISIISQGGVLAINGKSMFEMIDIGMDNGMLINHLCFFSIGMLKLYSMRRRTGDQQIGDWNKLLNGSGIGVRVPGAAAIAPFL